jgi:hypothetical protein
VGLLSIYLGIRADIFPFSLPLAGKVKINRPSLSHLTPISPQSREGQTAVNKTYNFRAVVLVIQEIRRTKAATTIGSGAQTLH